MTSPTLTVCRRCYDDRKKRQQSERGPGSGSMGILLFEGKHITWTRRMARRFSAPALRNDPGTYL
jgi:hypothetical protein